MLWTPSPEFQLIISNLADGTQPDFNVEGTSITAGGSTNTKAASYTELLGGAAVTHDVYAIEIYLSQFGVGNTSTGTLVDIGVDPANGGSYTALINNLMGSNAGVSATTENGGLHYYFPLFIAAGTQIGARCQSQTASLNGYVLINCYCKPKRPELVRCGSYVTTFGANTGTSLGTAVTPGTASEGGWADIAGADTTVPHWFWQYGIGVNDQTMSNSLLFCDLAVGDASNKHLVIKNNRVITSTSETVTKWPTLPQGYYDVQAGVRVYGRAQLGGTLDSSYHMTAYAVGG